MQSLHLPTLKLPSFISRGVLIVSLLVSTAGFSMTVPAQANAETYGPSFMLQDAPGCGHACEYGPEKIIPQFTKVYMICYEDSVWRETNGQYTNRWLRVIPDGWNEAVMTPAPAVGNQMTVGYCNY